MDLLVVLAEADLKAVDVSEEVCLGAHGEAFYGGIGDIGRVENEFLFFDFHF